MNHFITLRNKFKLIFELGKIRIAQLVTLSTGTGYILASGSLDLHILVPVLGIFLMALGSGALNQYQERHRDKLMPRTRRRPLPSGRLQSGPALLISVMFMISGALILFIGTNPTAFSLGLLSAFWYNAVYTFLKRITPLAVIPGSLIGALPPLVGWASAGGNIFTPQALALALFFFIWQIPHFWLLLLNFGDDYEKAGYPSLTSLLDKIQLGRLTFMWIVATAVAILFMPLFGFGNSIIIFLLLFASALWLIWKSWSLLKPEKSNTSFLLAFRGINIFILSVMFLLTLDSLV